MRIGKDKLRVDPFGNVSPVPRCPYCGIEVSFWAVQSMAHTQHCMSNPQVIAKMDEMKAQLKEALKPQPPQDVSEEVGG